MKRIARSLKQRMSGPAVDWMCRLLMRSAARRPGRAPFGAEELKLVYRALQSQHLGGTNGKLGAAFESAFAAAYGIPYAVGSTSGTAAVHVALGALDLNPGDEIITGPITDMGSIIPILYQNAIPVFADVDETYNIDPADVERKITPRTRAIVAIHLFGNPCNLDALMEIARRHDLPLIEDSSQAHMTAYRGKLAGTIGDIGCFSFQQSKPMTTGEGGMTITARRDCYDRMKLFADKGFARKGWGPRAYLFHAPNYRMNELTAAVGLAQLRKVQRVVRRRSELGRRMTERLAGRGGVIPAPVTEGAEHTYWLYPIRLVDRDPQGLAAALREAGIASLPGYTGKPIYLCSESLRSKKTYGDSQFPFTLGVYEYGEGLCPNAERLLEQLLCIPWDESWTVSAVDHAAGVIERWLTQSAGPVLTVPAPAVLTSSPSGGPARPAVPQSNGARRRVALIGCGRIGEWHLRAYQSNPRAQVVAVADVDFSRAAKMASQVGARPYRSHTEMLAAEALDAASICTVPATHRDIAVDLLRSGVDVLCEKPLAVSVADLDAMAGAARTAGRLLMPAFKFRFHDEVQTVKDLLAAGGLGRIVTFRVMFGGPLEMAGTWYTRRELSGGGVIIDSGPHAIDLVRYLLGEIAELTARTSERQALGVEDTGTLQLRLESGTVGTVDLSWTIGVPSRTYLEIFGEDGAVLADLEGVTYRYRTWKEWKRQPNRTTAEEAFARQISHFLDVAGGQRGPAVTLEDGMKTQVLIEGAYATVNRGAVPAAEAVRA